MGVEVVEPLSSSMSNVPPRLRLAVRLALVAFELSTFPRRFSRMSLERRRHHLERIEAHDRSSSRAVPAAEDAGGAQLRARPRGAGRARDDARAAGSRTEPNRLRAAPPLDPGAMVAPAGVERCDVAIVGSGAGGAAAARVLAEAGLSVIVLEAGDYHDASSYSTDPLRGDCPVSTATVVSRSARDCRRSRCRWDAASAARRSSTPAPACAPRPTCWPAGVTTTGSPGRRDLEREFESLERDLLRDAGGSRHRRSQRRALPRRRRGAGSVQRPDRAQRRPRRVLRHLPERLRARRQAGGARVGAAPRRRSRLRRAGGGQGRAA